MEMYKEIMTYAADKNASDIHFEPSEENVRIRLRIDGKITAYKTVDSETYTVISNKILYHSGIDVLAAGTTADGRYSEYLGGVPYNIRVSVLPVLHGMKIVLRLLRKNTVYNISNIGLSEKEHALADKIIHSLGGLVLVAGPTGSGKTTTLYSFIQVLNNEGLNISTVEDPIEYEIDGVNQSQVNIKTGYSFSVGLKSILRQDPDIIMIGEIRDEETAQTAVSAAIAGKLVFATIHTSDSLGTVSRLINMGVKPYLLAESLLAVFSQRLVNIIVSGKPTKRTAVYEIFVPSDDARRIIERGTDIIELRRIVENEGFEPLSKKLHELFENNRIPYEDLIRLSAAE